MISKVFPNPNFLCITRCEHVMLSPGGQSRKPRCVLRLSWHLIHVNISTKVNIKTAALPSLDIHTVHATISSHLDAQPLPKGSPPPAALQSSSHSSDRSCSEHDAQACKCLWGKGKLELFLLLMFLGPDSAGSNRSQECTESDIHSFHCMDSTC